VKKPGTLDRGIALIVMASSMDGPGGEIGGGSKVRSKVDADTQRPWANRPRGGDDFEGKKPRGGELKQHVWVSKYRGAGRTLLSKVPLFEPIRKSEELSNQKGSSLIKVGGLQGEAYRRKYSSSTEKAAYRLRCMKAVELSVLK